MPDDYSRKVTDSRKGQTMPDDYSRKVTDFLRKVADHG